MGLSWESSLSWSLIIFEYYRIDPILPEDRTDTRLYQMFFVWFSANINVLACVFHAQM